MYLLYCDETNLEEKSGDFFVYAGIAINSATAKALSKKIDDLRAAANVSRDFRLKFNPKPDNVEHPRFNQLKQEIIQSAIEHDVKLLVSVILHDIAKSPDEARRNAINTICYHFDCVLNRQMSPGVVLIDRFTDKQIDDHLAEKFSVGVTGLPFSPELRLGNVVGFHYSAIGQSNFSSLIDIVIGSLRFSINAFTRNDGDRLNTASKLIKMISPLFFREQGRAAVPELGLFFSPKTVKVANYRDQYVALKKFLADNGIETVQKVDQPQ